MKDRRNEPERENIKMWTTIKRERRKDMMKKTRKSKKNRNECGREREKKRDKERKKEGKGKMKREREKWDRKESDGGEKR